MNIATEPARPRVRAHAAGLPRRAARALLIGSVVVATACSGGGTTPRTLGSSPSSPSATPTRPSVTPSATTHATPTPLKTGKPKQGVKPSPTASAKNGTVVWLDRTCGRRGKDVQALNARTEPGGPVGYNTQYSDGSYYGDGHSQYSGGYSRPAPTGDPAAGLFADSNGNFRAEWTIPVNAPLGNAAVRVTTQDGAFEVTYRVVATTGSCS
jgi:hypothetical protein